MADDVLVLLGFITTWNDEFGGVCPPFDGALSLLATSSCTGTGPTISTTPTVLIHLGSLYEEKNDEKESLCMDMDAVEETGLSLVTWSLGRREHLVHLACLVLWHIGPV